MTKLDLSMQCHTFELDEESCKLCTFATPFGLFGHKRLPMGVSCAPDIAQQMMEDLLREFSADVEVCTDDVTLFGNSWEEHMQLIDKALTRLQDAGFAVNPLKCE